MAIEFQDFPFYAMMSSEPRFHKGIAEFNHRRFFEAHEVWEDLWHEYRDHDRTFLQGLIQIAAGCYHLQSDNLNGASSLIDKGLAKLGRYGTGHAGIDLVRFLDSCEGLLDAVAVGRLEGGSAINGQLIPTIVHLSEDRLSE